MEYLVLNERHGWKVTLGYAYGTRPAVGAPRRLIMLRSLRNGNNYDQHHIPRQEGESDLDYYLRGFREHGEIMARLGRKLPPFGDDAENRWP